MMIQSGIRIGTFLMLVAVAFSILAQDSRVNRIDPAGESTRVYLSYLNAAAEENFAKIFDVPSLQDCKPFALLLTNASGQSIVYVTVRWTGISGDRTIIHDSSSGSLLNGASGAGSSMSGPGSALRPAQVQRSSSYSSAQGPVVLATGERMLVAPGLLVSEAYAMQRGRAGGSSSMPQALRSAEMVSAILDAVVLEDGTVLGPDASHTIDGLSAHKAAIDFVVRAVRVAEQNGMDGAESLRILANAQPNRDQSPEVREQALQQSRLARTLMNLPNWKDQLAKLEALRLPTFHRK